MRYHLPPYGLAGVFGLLLTLNAHASVNAPQRVNTPQQPTTTQTQTQGVSTSEQGQAQGATAWGLTETEWQQYQQVLNGPRGIQSPGIDPLMALGIEAKTATERRHFADLWVKQEYARAEKELAFQRDVDQAWQRLFPSVLPVNLGHANGIASKTQGRLALFVKQDCPPCDARLSAMLADNRPVDIYLVDSGADDSVIRQWALSQRIPIDKVRDRHITLNHDNGRWLKYGQGRMPVILQQGASGWNIIGF